MASNNYGLNNEMDYYEYVFDSADASRQYNPFESSLNWPLFYVGGKEPLKNIAALKVLEVQIPFSYYVFWSLPNGQNNCTCTFTNELGSTSMVFPVGNYTALQLATIFAAELNAAQVTLGGPNNAYTVTYDQYLQKFVATRIIGANQFSVTFAPGVDTSPAAMLGFSAGTTNTSVGLVLTSTNVAALSGPNYLYLNSRTIGPLVSLYLPQGASQLNSGNAGPQIAKIPVNVSPDGIIYWSDPDPEKYFNMQTLVSLNELDLYFTLGNTSRLLSFNGLSFSIKLGVLLWNPNSNKTVNSEYGSMSRVIKPL